MYPGPVVTETMPASARLWGPQKLADGLDRFNTQLFAQPLPVTYRPPSPRPTIQNGGSATIDSQRCTCVRALPRSWKGISC